MVGTPALPLKGARVQSLVEEVVRCGKKKKNKTKTVDFGILQTHLFLQRKIQDCSKGLQLRKKNSSWARIPEAEHRPRSLRPHGEHLPPFRKKTNCLGDPSPTPQMSLLPSREAEP